MNDSTEQVLFLRLWEEDAVREVQVCLEKQLSRALGDKEKVTCEWHFWMCVVHNLRGHIWWPCLKVVLIVITIIIVITPCSTVNLLYLYKVVSHL